MSDSENSVPSEDADDVQGHRRTGIPVTADEDDVQGHRRAGIPVTDDEDDVEGHKWAAAGG